MSEIKDIRVKWDSFCQKLQPGLGKVAAVFAMISKICGLICDYIIKFRKIILAIPVVAGAVYLAMKNMKALPETVGINLLSSGEYAYLLSRNLAIMGPLAVTALCLLLMMFSKKTLYPWLISIFSLILPLLILLTNRFPA